ncbi:hypothetical protein V492_05193, partial [Pseudogymnoascus sp. VKM F-4246]
LIEARGARLTPASRDTSAAASPAIPTFARALMGPPELTPSTRRKGSGLENPADKRFRSYTSPYTSPYGSRAPSVFEDESDEESRASAGVAGGPAAIPGQQTRAAASVPARASEGASASFTASPVPFVAGRVSPFGFSAFVPAASVSGASGLTATAAPFVPASASSGLTATAAPFVPAGLFSSAVAGASPAGVSPGVVAGRAAGASPGPAGHSSGAVAGRASGASLGPAGHSSGVAAGGVAGASPSPAGLSPGLAAAPGPVGSPNSMPTPVEFIATRSLRTGNVADSVSAAVLELTSTKIAAWKVRARANNHSEESWAQPLSKRNLCVAVKLTKVKNPAWPANNYYNPADADPEFACPICVNRGSPCVWSRRDAIPRVLPLPPHARTPGATPQSAGFYITQ